MYFAVYAPVWLAWVGFVLYTDRFSTDEVSDSLVIGFSTWWGFFDALDQAPIKEVRTSRRTGQYKIWVFAQSPLAADVAALGIAVGNLVEHADAVTLDDSQRWLACGMVALCYVAHAIVHIAYAEAGAGRTAWLIPARSS